MKIVKRCSQILSLGLMLGSVLSCGSAPAGFYAPQGSTVTISDLADYKFPAAGGTIRGLVNVAVLVTKTDPVIGDTAGSSVTTIGGNKIFVRMICARCTFLKKGAGDKSFTLSTAVTDGNELNTQTDSNGRLIVGVELRDPAAEGFVSGTYQASITADIVVASAIDTVGITVDAAAATP